MKKKVSPWEVSGHILDALGKGILLTTAAEGKVNTMTIAWGTMGIQWAKPVFIAFVRQSRYSKELLEKNPEFTVNIPYGDFDKSIISFCGTKSGRDVDKFETLGLIAEPGNTVSVPGIRQLPLTLECKVIYKQDQDRHAITEENTRRYYPQNEQFPQGDYHTAYYGEITDAYILVDET